MKNTNWKPAIVFGLLIMFGLMLGAMLVVALMLPGLNVGGPGMWGVMIWPALGLVIMFLIMLFFIRRMAGSGGSISGMLAMMLGQPQNPPTHNEEHNLPTLTYTIPAVNCAHCKLTIERQVGNLAGVASVGVDVAAKQAIIKYDSPATETEIKALLAEIGYPPENQ